MQDLWIPLIFYAFSTSFSPGPNNMMLMSSGVNFGIKKSIPHVFGISLGFFLMILVIGFGLGPIFKQYPMLQNWIALVGAVCMLYLAYRITQFNTSSLDRKALSKPFTFLQIALFQWVNPKAWIMATTMVLVYTSPTINMNMTLQVIIVAVIFMIIDIPLKFVWLTFGFSLHRFLKSPKRLRVFNFMMAILLMMSLIPMLYEMI